MSYAQGGWVTPCFLVGWRQFRRACLLTAAAPLASAMDYLGGTRDATVSFRQAGKQTSGQLRRGFVSGQQLGAKKTSSIPSKFETTLYTGARPKEGFGTSAHRFTEPENDLPGPGAYDSAGVPLRDDKVYSKKGLGVGFVSRDTRKGIVTPNAVPGPGNYEEKRTLTREMAARTAFNQGGSSSAFKPPTRRFVAAARDSQPGPGHYGNAPVPGTFEAQQASFRRERTVRQSEAARSAALQVRMQSGGLPMPPKRIMPPTSSSIPLPAPGQYQPKTPSDMSNPERSLPSAAFRSSVPAAGAKKPTRASLEQQLGILPSAETSTPGPGQYPGADAPPNPSNTSRNTPAFCESKLDRFGRALPGARRVDTAVTSTPGPGQYYKEPTRESAPISSAVFMSGSTRVQDPSSVGVPGPAYYRPEAAPTLRKSHHLNVQQRWLPAT